MKWLNKGHEFDCFYETMKKINKVYIWGCGFYGKAAFEVFTRYEMQVAGFIDNDCQKWGKTLNDKVIYNPTEINLENDEVIIVCVTPRLDYQVSNQLKEMGYIEKENYYTMNNFIPIYYALFHNKAILSSIGFQPSSVCNLNCKACLNFTSHREKELIQPLDKLKEEIDLLFEKIDYIIYFHITGGEPLLYKSFVEIVEYIGSKYRDKIYYFQTTTNGTIIPSEKQLEVISKYNMDVMLDDYRDNVPLAQSNFSQVTALFDAYNVNYQVFKADNWIDLAPMKDYKELSEEELRGKFELCRVPWQEYRDGKLYLCNYASFAISAGLARANADETFDLKSYDKKNLMELIEFRMGYSRKGYTEFCKRCAGFCNNPYVTPVAEQITR